MMRKFTAVPIFAKSVAAFLANVLPFMVVALLVHLPETLLLLYCVHSGTAEPRGAAIFLGLSLMPIAMGTITLGVLRNEDGNRGRLAFGSFMGFSRLLRIVLVGFSVGAATILSFALFFFPGLVVATSLWVAIPVAAVERTSVREAFARSQILTEGNRREIFRLFILTMIVVFWASVVATEAMSKNLSSPLPILVRSIVKAFATAFVATTQAASYRVLRSLRENEDFDDAAIAAR